MKNLGPHTLLSMADFDANGDGIVQMPQVWRPQAALSMSPAPTVVFVASSTSTKAPVARISA